MWEFIKLNLMLIIAIVCGPFFAVLLSFYVDIISLSQEYKFLQYINYDWKLLIVFGIFWIGIYFSLAFWSGLKRLIYKAPKLDWWQTETFYQIYVKSFFDSNGDGVGDLRGLLQKLDYVQSLGAKTILLNPIYPSGGKNGGYDVTSYIEIDPVYGSIKDFDELVDEVHRRDMHILLDFVPYHTSNSHQWFVESCKDEPNNRFKDFFIWQRSKDSQTPPNNWKSVFGGPAWTYVESRKAWYFHQFLPEQPTLNLRSAEVKAELEAVVTFWLERKRIDGFLLNAVENFHFASNLENTESDLKHVQTMNQSATFDLLNEWRTLLTNLSKRTKSNKVLIVETSSGVNQLGKYYTHENRKRAHLVINKQFCLLNRKSVEDHTVAFKPTNLKALIEEYKTHLPKCCWASWQLGNNSISRVASRVGIENANLANALNLLLGGTAIIYYGEEIGMEDLPKECLKFEECQDDIAKIKGPNGFSAYSRDFERTPMQWDNSDFAGFSKSNRSWLPVSPNFKDLNVKAQSEQKKSTLALLRELVELRSHPSFQYGSIKMITINEQIFSFLRKAFGCDVYLVCMNISDTNANVNLLVSNEIAPRAYVALYIPGTLYTESGGNSAEDIDLDAKYKLKAPVLTKNVFLKPRDCLILTWPTSD